MNRVVLITGASRGIGAAIARDFAKKQDIVVLNYCHSQAQAESLQRELEEQGREALAIQADVSKESDVQRMVDCILNRYGRIDVLVNNAAISLDDEFENHTVKNFQKILSVNLIGPFLVSKYVSFSMLKQQKGVIINISSNNGIDCYSPISLDYDASKAGVISLTHDLALACAPYIRVVAVAPGWTRTESVLEALPEFLEQEREKILLERFAHPEEIAKVVTFLASDDASYINGEVIRVDGGIK